MILDLILTESEVNRLKDNAKWNPISNEVMKALAKGDSVPIAGDQKEFTMIAGDFRIVYTHEDQPIGMCRHISVSVYSNPSIKPSDEAMSFICKEFGFINELTDMPNWIEKFGPGSEYAINVLEPLEIYKKC